MWARKHHAGFVTLEKKNKANILNKENLDSERRVAMMYFYRGCRIEKCMAQ